MPLELLLLEATKQPVTSLQSNSTKQFAAFAFGENIPLEVGRVLPSLSINSVFDPKDWDGYTAIKAAIGNGFVAPIAGVWYLLSERNLTSGTITSGKRFKIITFLAGDDFTNVGAASNATGVIFTATGTTPTTWTHSSVLQEITINLQYNAIASDIQAALNATAFVPAAGGLSVAALEAETVNAPSLYYTLTFSTVGAQIQISGGAENLAPLSIIETGTLIDGTTQIAEVQTIRLLQDCAAFVILDTDSDDISITVDEVVTGGSGPNAQYRITIDPPAYKGGFIIFLSGFQTPTLIYNISADDMSSAIASLSKTAGLLTIGVKYKEIKWAIGDDFTNVGSPLDKNGQVFIATGTTPTNWTHGSILSPVGDGNVSVIEDNAGVYLITFLGDMANTDMGTMSVDGSTLRAIPYKLGALNLDTPGVELLLGGQKSVQTNFAITCVPPGQTYPQEILRMLVTINAPVSDPASETPQPRDVYYTKAEVDAIIAGITPVGGTLEIGTEARLIAITHGFKIQVSADGGATWQDAPTYLAS